MTPNVGIVFFLYTIKYIILPEKEAAAFIFKNVIPAIISLLKEAVPKVHIGK
jgi:hypothetical protein